MNGIKVVVILILSNTSQASISDYFSTVSSFFGYKEDSTSNALIEAFDQKIPYEVSVVDEKFIAEATRLTGVAVSELDSCQHRVVLKLKTSCHQMNDEQVAKMAVMLLNCQSSVEGRRMYPCTAEMSIKDCTTSMDADTWNTYHLMSNRARAVCYSVRQSQFAGLTEYAVNRLMDTTLKQIDTLGKLVQDHEDLQNIAQNTLDSVSKGNDILLSQQRDLHKAQLYGQLSIEDNIKRLTDEKHLIATSHRELASLTATLQAVLEYSAKQLEEQTKESNVNHGELLEDLATIQQKAQSIFQKIEDSSKLLIKQSEEASFQYEVTLKQLAEVNKTVHSLVALVGGTRQALEDRLNWITAVLGGTDLAVDRLYMLVWHALFLIVSMVTCAFLGANLSTRIVVATAPSLNLALGLHDIQKSLSPLGLSFLIGSCIAVQMLVFGLALLYNHSKNVLSIPWRESAAKSQMSTSDCSAKNSSSNRSKDFYLFPTPNNQLNGIYKQATKLEADDIDQEDDSFSEYCSPTPPLSRSGRYISRSRSRTPLHINTSLKASCKANTRVGTPCKLTALPGRDFCYRHQTGDSVLG